MPRQADEIAEMLDELRRKYPDAYRHVVWLIRELLSKYKLLASSR